jgi:hypothetical protein
MGSRRRRRGDLTLDYDKLGLRNCGRQHRLQRVRRLWRMGVATYLVGVGALAVGWTDRSVLALIGLPLAVALCLGVPYGAYLWWRQTESTAVWIGPEDDATATATPSEEASQ